MDESAAPAPGRDRLRLEVSDVEVSVLTGVLSEETNLPQPLRISVLADLDAPPPFAPETPLSASKNYMDMRDAVTALPRDRHFTLIEAVADHITAAILGGDARVRRVEVRIVKLAISTGGESIGITLVRHA